MRTDIRLRNGDHSFAASHLFLFAIAYFGRFSILASRRTNELVALEKRTRPIRNTLASIREAARTGTARLSRINSFKVGVTK